jgi:hypothetical protein
VIGYAARRRCRASIENLPAPIAAPYRRLDLRTPAEKSIGAEAEACVDRKKVAGSAASHKTTNYIVQRYIKRQPLLDIGTAYGLLVG